ncbi:hypothetical protein ACWA1C_06495 [Flectobacillus roseus]
MKGKLTIDPVIMEQELHEQEVQREYSHQMSKLLAMEQLLQNNDFACEITVCGLSVSICNNDWLLPVIVKEKRELDKFLVGEPNLYE